MTPSREDEGILKEDFRSTDMQSVLYFASGMAKYARGDKHHALSVRITALPPLISKHASRSRTIILTASSALVSGVHAERRC